MLSAHPSLSIPALDAFQRQLTPFNSTPTFARIKRPSASERVARLVTIYALVFLGLVFVSSPLALFSFVNDLARALNPKMDTHAMWLSWAKGRGALSGFIFQVRSIHWSPYDRVGVVNADP